MQKALTPPTRGAKKTKNFFKNFKKNSKKKNFKKIRGEGLS